MFEQQSEAQVGILWMYEIECVLAQKRHHQRFYRRREPLQFPHRTTILSGQSLAVQHTRCDAVSRPDEKHE